jgi:hypothetical protein
MLHKEVLVGPGNVEFSAGEAKILLCRYRFRMAISDGEERAAEL